MIALYHQTPFEAWHGWKPKVSHFKSLVVFHMFTNLMMIVLNANLLVIVPKLKDITFMILLLILLGMMLYLMKKVPRFGIMCRDIQIVAKLYFQLRKLLMVIILLDHLQLHRLQQIPLVQAHHQLLQECCGLYMTFISKYKGVNLQKFKSQVVLRMLSKRISSNY